jgi:hypothetical protein
MGSEPELAENMNAAFKTICRSLGVTEPGLCASEQIATKIVELVKDGVCDPDELSHSVLNSLNLPE